MGLVAILLGATAGSVLGAAEGAASAAAEAKALLAKADFEGALKAYASAAKADPENPAYRDQFALLRRIIKMRQTIEEEKNPEKWAAAAQALRAFYYEHRIYSEALKLDQATHSRVNTPASAVSLAETQLQLGLNAEAAELLGKLTDEQATPQSQLLLGIALARQGNAEPAKALAEKCRVPDDAGPGLLFDAARLRCLVGDVEGALRLLTRCFEMTPPSRLEGFKGYAKECPDLKTAVAHADFARVLETASKVKESSCSGGASCGSCPSKNKCPSGKSSTSTGGK